MALLKDLLAPFNITVSSFSLGKGGINVIRNISLSFLSPNYISKGFYASSAIFNILSMVGIADCIKTRSMPFQKFPVSNLVLAMTLELGGGVVSRLHECKDLESITLTAVCVDTLLKECEVWKKYIPISALLNDSVVK